VGGLRGSHYPIERNHLRRNNVNPLVKKAIAAVAIAKGIGKIRDMRKPKRSRASRFSPMLALAGLGAGVFYLNKTGKLQPVIAKAKSMGGGNRDDAVLEDSLRPPTANTI
jgi:hypothetical protein